MTAFELLHRAREAPAAFARGYVDFLRHGGSRPPLELLAGLGVRLDGEQPWSAPVARLDSLA